MEAQNAVRSILRVAEYSIETDVSVWVGVAIGVGQHRFETSPAVDGLRSLSYRQLDGVGHGGKAQDRHQNRG